MTQEAILSADGSDFRGVVDPFADVSIGFFSISWILFTLLVVFNFVTRFCWLDKAQDPPPEPIPTVCDPCVEWPFIHWIAVGVWSTCFIGLVLGLSLSWVGLRTSLFCLGWSDWPSAFSAQTTFLIVLSIFFTYFRNEFLVRLIGQKSTFGSCHYTWFLFGPCLPMIVTIVLTVSYSIITSPSFNPAIGIPELVFLERTFEAGYDSDRYSNCDSDYYGSSYNNYCRQRKYIPTDRIVQVASKLWAQNQSLSQGLLAFVILSWIGFAGLTTINLLSSFDIRPKEKAIVVAEP
jgi:hypothetical protein